ncbi:alpha/beta fold hydrolase [Planococcus sp. YIM B11945]|uniref:alpha/beta fold hydrolase n=1 Tax=Planococcus sp. YIM B11945 TaxID=3435410 RepID=UPI003D7D795E
MPRFESKGVQLYYVEAGEGAPLVLIHGLTASLMTFQQEIEYFQDHFRVIAYDCRGHGRSDKPLSYTLNDHIEDVVALLDHLGIGKAHVLGVSMGSYIAQGLVLAHPERVEKLVLVVSKSNGKTSSTQELFNRHADEIEGMEEQEQQKHLFKYMFRNLAAVEEWQKESGLTEQTLTLIQQAAANKALEGFDFRRTLPTVESPTLVISGTHDGLNPPERGREIAGLIPDALFVEFENSGHAPNVEESELFLDVTTDFLMA